MAAAYLSELRQLQPRGPYHLSGYSGGGVVAFEMAQRLRRARRGGRVPRPHRHLSARDVSDAAPARLVVTRAAAESEAAPRIPREPRQERRIARIYDEASFAVSVGWRRALGLPIPHELRKNWVGRELLRAVEDYHATAYDGRIVLFRASEEDKFHLSFKQLGWDGLATQGIEVVLVPGDHDTLALEPNARVLAEKLRERLR